MDERAIARLYLLSKTDEKVIVQLPRTNYQTYLMCSEAVEPTPQGRVRGVVRLPVWKVDFVSAGGSFIEPVYGRPKRVHGTAIGAMDEGNSLIVEVCDQPMVADLPARWQAAEIEPGTRVGLDVHEGATFSPAPQAAKV